MQRRLKGAWSTDRTTSFRQQRGTTWRQHTRSPTPGPYPDRASDHLGPGSFMRYQMSADAERRQTGHRLHTRRQNLPARRAVRCPVESAREVVPGDTATRRWPWSGGRATRSPRHHRRIRDRGRAGVVRRTWLNHPNLPNRALRARDRAANHSSTLPAGKQPVGLADHPVDAAQPVGDAMSAFCLSEPGPSFGARRGSSGRGNGITAGAGRDAGGGRPYCRQAPDPPVAEAVT